MQRFPLAGGLRLGLELASWVLSFVPEAGARRRRGVQVGLAVASTCVATIHGCTSGAVEAGNRVSLSFESLDPFGNKVRQGPPPSLQNEGLQGLP